MKRIAKILSDKYFYILFLLPLITSCRSTQKIEEKMVEREFNDMFNQTISRDSIYVSDSIWIRETPDTIFLTRYHTIYRDKFKHDTIHLRDTVYSTVYRDKVIEKKSSSSVWFFGLALFFVGCFISEAGFLGRVIKFIKRMF